MSERPLIRAESLGKVYGDGDQPIPVLVDLELEVPAGEKLVIVGESGVGKSTLLHVLGTLDRPTSGCIWFDDTNLSQLSERELANFRNREVGFIFQFHHLLPDFSALENVMMPALIRGEGFERADARARECLAHVGLTDRLTHKPGELSGGEQQRVAIARAVMGAPRVIYADEPTGNLDPATADSVHHLIVELNRAQGITFVIVTHNERLAALADRTLRLHDGKLT